MLQTRIWADGLLRSQPPCGPVLSVSILFICVQKMYWLLFLPTGRQACPVFIKQNSWPLIFLSQTFAGLYKH